MNSEASAGWWLGGGVSAAETGVGADMQLIYMQNRDDRSSKTQSHSQKLHK